jgi:hypothetical protein
MAQFSQPYKITIFWLNLISKHCSEFPYFLKIMYFWSYGMFLCEILYPKYVDAFPTPEKKRTWFCTGGCPRSW